MSLDNKIAAALTALAAALLLFTVAARSAETGSGIVVKPAAAVEGAEVLVGDISYPVGRQARDKWLRIKDEPLTAAPAASGDQVPYPRDKLAYMLGKKLGREARDFILPLQLVVQRGGAVIDEHQLRLDVVEFLTARLAGVQGEPVLRDYRLPEFIFLQRRDNRLGVEVKDGIEPGRLSLRFTEFGPAGETGGKHTGSVFLDLWVSVPCAARPLNPGDRLLPEAVRYERKNMAYLRGKPWNGKDFNLRLKRSVGEGQAVYADDLEEIPVIAEGDEVSLVFQGEYVRLEVPAEALSDGRVGEMIRVRNLQSERVVSARVKDSGIVTVN